MKLKSLASVALASALVAGPANANMLFDIYAGASAGLGRATWFADGHDSFSSQSYGAMLGINIPLVRGEVEYNYLTHDDAKLHLAMVNGYVKLPMPIVKPYLGAGMGMVFDGEFDDLGAERAPAYQGMLGVTLALPIIPFDIDVEGRVLYANHVFKTGDDTANLLQYDARVKLRYVF
ncbi:porin family protein [bacterium]|nr:porin family protein [bacterium]